MPRAKVVKSGLEINNFDYQFDIGEVIEYKYDSGMVQLLNVEDSRGAQHVNNYFWHSAIEKGFLEIEQ